MQGIHDRFIRDQEFRNRMIENHRDEELCRRWDALADEDHTHDLSEQEYFYYKSQPGGNDCNKKQGSRYHAIEKSSTYSYKHQQCEARSHLLHGGMVHGGLFYHSECQDGDASSTELTVRPVACSIWQHSSEKDFHEFNLFCYRLIVYS